MIIIVVMTKEINDKTGITHTKEINVNIIALELVIKVIGIQW